MPHLLQREILVIPNKALDVCSLGAACFAGVSLSAIDMTVQIVAGLIAAAAGSVSLYGKWKNRKVTNDRPTA